MILIGRSIWYNERWIRGDILSFLDNLQENLDDIKIAVSGLSRKVMEDTSQLRRVAKIRIDIARETKNLNDLYKSLGEYYFKLNKGIESQNFELEKYIEKIETTIARIESLKMTLKTTNTNSTTTDLEEGHQKDEVIYFDQEDLK